MVLTWWKLQKISFQRAYNAHPLSSTDRIILPLAVGILFLRSAANGWQLMQSWTASAVPRDVVVNGIFFHLMWVGLVLLVLFSFLAMASMQQAAFPQPRIACAPVRRSVVWWAIRGPVIGQPIFWILFALSWLIALLPVFVVWGWWGLVVLTLCFLSVGSLTVVSVSVFSKVPAILSAAPTVLLPVLVLINPNYLNIQGEFKLILAGNPLSLGGVVAGPSPVLDGSRWFHELAIAVGNQNPSFVALVFLSTLVSVPLFAGSFNAFARWREASARFLFAPQAFAWFFSVKRTFRLWALTPYSIGAALALGSGNVSAASFLLALGLVQIAVVAWIGPLVSLQVPSREGGQLLPMIVLAVLPGISLSLWGQGLPLQILSICFFVLFSWMVISNRIFLKRLRGDWERQKATIYTVFRN